MRLIMGTHERRVSLFSVINACVRVSIGDFESNEIMFLFDSCSRVRCASKGVRNIGLSVCPRISIIELYRAGSKVGSGHS